jgi:predicted pyridoxine 5'-phosphate oxidase superfamily flavin-nucleotide-binding protein
MSIIEQGLKIMKAKEFVTVATADKKGKPNSAPKLLLKIDGKIVYFIDYSIGKTAENLKVNPEVSLSFIDVNFLLGYRLNGKVEIIEKGKIYNECLEELREKETELSVERIVKGVHEGKPHEKFEVEIPERFLVYKVKIEEGCEISPHGDIKREDNR